MTSPAPTRHVVLVCGPPGAGKSTLARATGLPVYDLDDPKWLGSEPLFRRALEQLAYTRHAQAAVIRSGARATSRRAWVRLIGATEVVVIDTPAPECKARVIARNRPRPPLPQQLAAVDRWWRTYVPDPPTPLPASREW